MKSEPHYRRPLNDQQIHILHTLYRFRFTTTELLMQTEGATNKHKMNHRLKVLLDQDYIGRNYDPSYHLSGRHASYYLAAKGLKTLRAVPDSTYSASVLRNMSKDKTASERFINHWLQIFDINCLLKSKYKENIRLFTKSQLAAYEYFPHPTPDIYIRLVRDGVESQYILDVVDSSQPIFVQLARIKKYQDYAEEGDWEDATGTALPTVLLVCESTAQKNRLLKLAESELDDLDSDDITIEITIKGEVSSVIDAKK